MLYSCRESALGSDADPRRRGLAVVYGERCLPALRHTVALADLQASALRGAACGLGKEGMERSAREQRTGQYK